MPPIDAIPFESQHQYMATLHSAGADNPGVMYVKGSVETILEKCALSLDGAGQPVVLDAERVHAAVGEMAAKGVRVLAFARGEIKRGATGLHHPDVASGLIFLGLQGMIDPPRQEAIDAVAACHAAGIRVAMITGDHRTTATAIGQQLGLRGEAVTGVDLAAMDDAELDRAVEALSQVWQAASVPPRVSGVLETLPRADAQPCAEGTRPSEIANRK